MSTAFFLSWQFGFTLILALAIGIWQFVSIRRSRAKRGESGHVSHPSSGPNTELPPHRSGHG